MQYCPWQEIDSRCLDCSAERLSKASGPTLFPSTKLHPHPAAAETGTCFQSGGRVAAVMQGASGSQRSMPPFPACSQQATSVFKA